VCGLPEGYLAHTARYRHKQEQEWNAKEIIMTTEKPIEKKPPSRPRLFYIDNLRILLTILVILHHLGIIYGGSGDFAYKEPGRMGTVSTILMTLFLTINQSFFMGFFFMISSYFTPGSVDRKGAWPYLKDRLIRLGIPFLFYMVVISPLLGYRLSLHYGYQGSIGSFFGRFLEDVLGIPELPVGPLWFVEALLILSFFYVVWRLLAKPATTVAPSEGTAPSNLVIAGFALVLGLLTFVVRIWLPQGWRFALLGFQFPFFVQYIALFVVGILAYRRNWFAALSPAQAKVWRWIILVLVVVFFVIFLTGGALEGNVAPFLGGVTWQSLAFSVWEQFMCMAMVVTLLVWFRTRFNQQGPLAKRLSAAAYATYIFHEPVIVLLALALGGIGMDLGLKFVLVAPVAVSLSFLVGYAIKQLPLARRIL
jgi:glucan biosynthesis protein C